jgi:hypothetical protein
VSIYLLLIVSLLFLLMGSAGAQEITDEIPPPSEVTEEGAGATELPLPEAESVSEEPVETPLLPMGESPTQPPAVSEPVLPPDSVPPGGTPPQVPTAVGTPIPVPLIATPTVFMAPVASATPTAPALPALFPSSTPTLVALLPAPCATPTSDGIHFTAEFLVPLAENVTNAHGTIANNSGWAAVDFSVTVGAFGQASVVQRNLAPGQSTRWSLRVGGQHATIPTQLSWTWVYPPGCA